MVSRLPNSFDPSMYESKGSPEQAVPPKPPHITRFFERENRHSIGSTRTKSEIYKERFLRLIDRSNRLLSRYSDVVDTTQLKEFYRMRNIYRLQLPEDLQRRMTSITLDYQKIVKELSAGATPDEIKAFLDKIIDEADANQLHERRKELEETIEKSNQSLEALSQKYSAFWDLEIKPVKIQIQRLNAEIRKCEDPATKDQLMEKLDALNNTLSLKEDQKTEIWDSMQEQQAIVEQYKKELAELTSPQTFRNALPEYHSYPTFDFDSSSK